MAGKASQVYLRLYCPNLKLSIYHYVVERKGIVVSSE